MSPLSFREFMNFPWSIHRPQVKGTNNHPSSWNDLCDTDLRITLWKHLEYHWLISKVLLGPFPDPTPFRWAHSHPRLPLLSLAVGNHSLPPWWDRQKLQRLYAGRDMILMLRNAIFAILHSGNYKEEVCNRKLWRFYLSKGFSGKRHHVHMKGQFWPQGVPCCKGEQGWSNRLGKLHILFQKIFLAASPCSFYPRRNK